LNTPATPLRILSIFLAVALPAFGLGADTSLTVSGGLNNQTFHFTPDTGAFRAEQNGGRGVSITYDGGGLSRWDLDFTAPYRASLKPGYYYGAGDYPFHDFTQPGFSIYPGGEHSTKFEVKRIIYGPDFTIISFWATFEQIDSGDFYSPWKGEIKFNADATGEPTNQFPIAYAGPDLRITLSTVARLEGRVDDDGFPEFSSLTAQWTLGVGPGPVTFSNPHAASTSASFSVPGEYTLHLTVFDGEYYRTDDVTLVVLDPAFVTSLSMTSDPGDYIGEGLKYDFDQLEGSYSAYRNPFHGVTVEYRSDGQRWNLDFVAPGLAPLGKGMYANIESYPWQDSDRPGMRVTGNGNGEGNFLTGWFEVKEVIYGINGEVVSFWATFEQHREGVLPALRGEVRFNVEIDPAPIVRIQPLGGIVPAKPSQLRAEVIDIGASGPLQTKWSVLEGPGMVTFENVEAVETNVTFGQPGAYRLRLTADDGVSVARDEVTFVVADGPSHFVGLLRSVTGGFDDGMVRLALTSTGKYTGSFSIGSFRYVLRGEFNDEGESSVMATSRQGGTIHLSMQRLENGTISLQSLDKKWDLTASLERLITRGGVSENYQNRFACVLAATEPAAYAPEGYGWGWLRINASGGARLTGKLGNGTPIVQNARITEFGRVPMVFKTARGDKFTSDIIVSANGITPTIEGTAYLEVKLPFIPIVPFDPIKLEVFGEKALQVSKNIEVLSGTDAAIDAVFTYGGPDRNDQEFQFTLLRGGKTQDFPLQIRPDGSFKGKFRDGSTQKWLPFSGVILGSRHMGFGFIEKKEAAGFVRISRPSTGN